MLCAEERRETRMGGDLGVLTGAAGGDAKLSAKGEEHN